MALYDPNNAAQIPDLTKPEIEQPKVPGAGDIPAVAGAGTPNPPAAPTATPAQLTGRPPEPPAAPVVAPVIPQPVAPQPLAPVPPAPVAAAPVAAAPTPLAAAPAMAAPVAAPPKRVNLDRLPLQSEIDQMEDGGYFDTPFGTVEKGANGENMVALNAQGQALLRQHREKVEAAYGNYPTKGLKGFPKPKLRLNGRNFNALEPDWKAFFK